MAVNDKSNFFRKYYKIFDNKKENNEQHIEEKPKKVILGTNKDIKKENNISIDTPIKEEKVRVIPTPPTSNVEEKQTVDKEEIRNKENNDVTIDTTIIKEKETESKEEILTPQTSKEVDEFEESIEDPELEISVINAIERIIRVDQHELDNIKFEIDVISQKTEEEFEIKEVELLKEKLEDLLRKFEKIKKRYENALNKPKKNYEIDEEIIYKMLKEYKISISDKEVIKTEEINNDIKVINEYIGVIETILLVEKNIDKVKKDTDEKKESLNIRDDDFELLKKEYENTEKVEKDIESFTKAQDKILKDLQYKINNSEKISKRIETESRRTLDLSKFMEATILYTASKKIPPTPTGMILKTSLILSAFSAMTNIVNVEERQKEVISVSYTDYFNSIKQSINDVDSIIAQIDKAQDGISALKEKFKKDLEEYEGLIPEYSKLINNIDNMAKKLNEQKDIATENKKEFDKTLVKNNTKVKRLEALKKNAT